MSQNTQTIKWYSWSKKTFQLAKKENKPVFVFITYPTCHFCMQMEQEVLSDSSVITLLNEQYISILVDKNLRPDIDMHFMEYAFALLGQAGWPLNLVLNHAQQPFFVASYLPLLANSNYLGFRELFDSLAKTYQNDPSSIQNATDSIQKVIEQHRSEQTTNKQLDEEVIANLYYQMQKNYDARNGGFDQAPKFILPANLSFLLDYAKLMRSKGAEKMIERTLHQIYKGAIFDHLHGGFYRYSNDNAWMYPHQEKMLLDNAQLLEIYARMYAHTKNTFYKDVSYQLIKFIEEALKHEQGGYYNALSQNHAHQLSQERIEDILSKEEYAMLQKHYDFGPSNAFALNLLHLNNHDLEDLPQDTLQSILEKANQAIQKQQDVQMDASILTVSNAYLAASYAAAAKILDDASLLTKAKNILSYLQQHNIKDDVLFRTTNQKAFLDDYAALIRAYLEVFLVSFEVSFLHEAIRLNRTMHDLFFDTQEKKYQFAMQSDLSYPQTYEALDTSSPSAQSIIAHNRFLLHAILDECEDTFKAKKQLDRFQVQMQEMPLTSVHMIHAYLKQTTHRIKIVIIYQEMTTILQEIIHQMHIYDSPFITFIALSKEEARKSPYFEEYLVQEPFLFTYCENGACDEPLLDEHEAIEYLDLFVLK